jgi:NAD+ kinase
MARFISEFNHISITSHPKISEAKLIADKISSFLETKGVRSKFGYFSEEEFSQRIESGETDLLIALGGDGTMLRSGQLCGPSSVPILGINLGKFGFLTEIEYHQWQDLLPQLFDGKFWIEERMMLRAEQWRGNTIIGAWEVLNEVVVTRGHIIRPVHLTANVDGRFLTTYVADGMIASTATGSTAYSLAAGGPILPPELRNILIVAVAPHLSVDRAIVLPEGATVSITVHTDHQAVLSPDGQPPIEMNDGDRVDAYASEHSAKFIRFQEPDYFYKNLTLHMSQNPSTVNSR